MAAKRTVSKGFTNTSVKKPLKVTEIKRHKNKIDEARIS